MAERVGFEPTAPCGVTGFQDQLLKPLGHLSITVLLYQISPIISNNRNGTDKEYQNMGIRNTEYGSADIQK